MGQVQDVDVSIDRWCPECQEDALFTAVPDADDQDLDGSGFACVTCGLAITVDPPVVAGAVAASRGHADRARSGAGRPTTPLAGRGRTRPPDQRLTPRPSARRPRPVA